MDVLLQPMLCSTSCCGHICILVRTRIMVYTHDFLFNYHMQRIHFLLRVRAWSRVEYSFQG